MQVLNVVSELLHEMPTNVIPIRSLGKGLVADRTRASHVDPLRLVEEGIAFFFDQSFVGQEVIQDGVHEGDVNGDVLRFVALVATLGALSRIFEVHDDVEELVAEVPGDVLAGRLLRVADGAGQAERDLARLGHRLCSLRFDQGFILKNSKSNFYLRNLIRFMTFRRSFLKEGV